MLKSHRMERAGQEGMLRYAAYRRDRQSEIFSGGQNQRGEESTSAKRKKSRSGCQ